MEAQRPSRPFLVLAAAALALLPLRGPAQQLPPEAAALLGAGKLPQLTGTPAPAASRPVEVLRAAEPAPAAAPAPPPAPPPPAPAPVTDFQRFAATSVGATLPIFGASLFGAPPSTFAPVDDLAPSADYLVGPGDELVVRGWGQVEIDVRAVVSREGTISIPRVGLVPVAGTRYQDLPAVLRAAVGRYYRSFELGVSLGRLRSIQVFVVGQAARPGLYTVGSLSTLMNALFASGGPSPTGSMRRIELRRGEKLVGELDLYDFLLRGDKSRDQRLQPGDVIFVPPVGPVAAIAGRVKTPAVYELRDQRTTLGDLLAYAGGPTTTADTHSLQVERLDPRLGRIVQELPWGEAALATPLRDGDVVLLRALSQKFDNAVTLRGNVAFPVRTQWKEGLTVADLIPDRGVLIPESYWERAAARALESMNARVENFLQEVNWDYAVVERLDRERLEPRLLPFNLRRAVVDRDPAHNLPLQPGDVVTVFSQRDVLAPSERRTFFVRVEGEVAIPGIYQVRPGETLRKLVERAGGLTRDAYLFGAELTRESVRREQQGRLEEVARRAEQELEHSAAERLSRATGSEEAAATRVQLEAQRGALARLRTLKASGRMVLELEPDAARAEQLPDLVLEDGDRLYVPYRYSTVGVFGAVYNQASFIHRPGKRLDEYLAQAGGPTRAADAGSTYVLRADGSVLSRRQAGWFGSFDGRTLMPNDAIVVPEDFAPVSWIRELKDWSQIFYQFGLGVAALKILRP